MIITAVSDYLTCCWFDIVKMSTKIHFISASYYMKCKTFCSYFVLYSCSNYNNRKWISWTHVFALYGDFIYQCWIISTFIYYSISNINNSCVPWELAGIVVFQKQLRNPEKQALFGCYGETKVFRFLQGPLNASIHCTCHMYTKENVDGREQSAAVSEHTGQSKSWKVSFIGFLLSKLFNVVFSLLRTNKNRTNLFSLHSALGFITELISVCGCVFQTHRFPELGTTSKVSAAKLIAVCSTVQWLTTWKLFNTWQFVSASFATEKRNTGKQDLGFKLSHIIIKLPIFLTFWSNNMWVCRFSFYIFLYHQVLLSSFTFKGYIIF